MQTMFIQFIRYTPQIYSNHMIAMIKTTGSTMQLNSL